MKKIIFILLSITVINATAQEGIINTNYADSGTRYYSLPPESFNSGETPLKQLSDSRVVTAFLLYDSVTKIRSINVMFYNKYGDLITTGGEDNGIRLSLPFSDRPFYNHYIEAITEQPDGKILIVGREITSITINTAYLIRCMPDGTADSTFGEHGIAKQVFYGIFMEYAKLEIAMAKSIALDSKQNILIGVTYGGAENGDTAMILRYLPTGLPDPSFGRNGILPIYSGANKFGGYISQLAVTKDDKILMTGNDGNPPEQYRNHFVVKRFNMDGTPDEGFGVQGKYFDRVQDQYQNYPPDYMRIDSKSKIVLGHQYVKNIIRSFFGFGILRLNENGYRDESFGENGVVLIDYKDSSVTDFRADMELQENDKIVFGATLNDVKINPTIYDAIVYRFNEDGSKDISFANGGEYRYDFIGVVDTVDTRDYLDNVEIGKNGDILLSGIYYSVNKSSGYIYYSRYLRLLNGDPTRLPWSVRIRRWIRNHVLHFTDNDPGTSTAYYSIANNVNGNAIQVATLPRNNSGVYSFSLPVADKSITYTVTAMQSNGEALSSFQITDASTSATHANLKLWPNPVSNFVNIEAGFAIKTIEIQHIQNGIIQKITGNNARTMQVQTAQLQPGIYSIMIRGVNGERVQEKFVKE